MASTVMADHPGACTFCTVCQGCDHLPSHCALAYIKQPVHQEGAVRPQGVPWLDPAVCWSWIEGRCSYPGPSCPRLHNCATCSSPHHRARDCKDTLPDSRFRHPPQVYLCSTHCVGFIFFQLIPFLDWTLTGAGFLCVLRYHLQSVTTSCGAVLPPVCSTF